MNTIKRRWPDLLIGLLVILLLAGFATLLLGKNRPGAGQTGAVQSADSARSSEAQTSASQTPASQTPSTASPTTQPETTQSSSAQAPTSAGDSGSTQSSGSPAAIPTIPSAPLNRSGASASASAAQVPATTPAAGTPATAPAAADTATSPATTPPTSSGETAAPRSGGAVATSETRTPTRNDYRISLGSYSDAAAVQAATAGVGRLGYTVYPIPVASGTVAQVGPFASREAAAQALADIQRALPGALLYPPRNAPAENTSSSAPDQTTSSSSAQTRTPAETGTAQAPRSSQANQTPPQTGAQLAASGPVYLQVGAYNSTEAAQTAVGRVRDLGLEPSVNAPAGKLVTVVVGPFEGRALTSAEAKLQAGGIDSFRVR